MNRAQIIHSTAVIVVLITGALVTRVVGLSSWHLWLDEYFTYFFASDRIHSLINPAYYWLTVVSFDIFGQKEWVARLPAVIFGVLGIPAVYLVGKRFVNDYVGSIAALFMLLSSWHLWYSQQARFYSAVVLFGLLAYFFLYQSVRRNSLLSLILGLILAVVATLFHATAVLILISFGTYCAVALIWRRTSDIPARVPIVVLASAVIGCLVLLPMLYSVLDSWRDTGQDWGYGPAAFVLQCVKYVQIPLAVAGALGFFVLLRRDLWLAVFFACSIVVPLMVLTAVAPYASVRPDYLISTLPLVAIFAASLCDEIRKVSRGPYIITHAMVLLIAGTMIPEFVSHYTDRRSLDVRDAFAYVEENRREGDRIMSFVNGYQLYGASDRELDRIPGSTSDNSVNWDEALADYGAPGTRAWLILPISRSPPAPRLGNWLAENAALVWRQTATRFDYTHRGYEIFFVDNTDKVRSGKAPDSKRK